MTSWISNVLLFLLQYFLLFSLGSILGWILELFWRRFVEEKRWINPGFLNGPWLPVYGFGAILLYLLCSLNIPLYGLILIFSFGLTLLEYTAGLIFVKSYKIKLWDYSKRRGNIHGLICPLYSFLWTLLGLVFYFFLFPNLKIMIDNLYLYVHLSFFIGIYVGFLLVDLWQSFDIAVRIRTFVDDTEDKWPIEFEAFKLELRDRVQVGFRNRTRFFSPFRGELGNTFSDRLKKHTSNLSGKLKPFSTAIKNRLKKNEED